MHLVYEMVNRDLSPSVTQKTSFKFFKYITGPENSVKASLTKTQQGVS